MSRVVRLKQGRTESAAIYAAIVALPGTKKTPAFKWAAGPAHEKQAEYRREYREAKKAHEEQRTNRRGEGEEDVAATEEPPPEPTLKRTVVEDTTIEALAVVLEDNPRGVLLARDEVSAFVRGMDQYKNHRGSDRQFYLSAWSNSPVSVDRKNLEEPIFLARPFVGVVGSIQPGVLPELIANRQGREGDGFLDRFLFFYEELSPQQEGAIVALLSDPGLTGAAKAAGVGKAILWRWMQQPAFREAYRHARRKAVEQARARQQQASGEAVEALREVMNDQDAPHASRVSAARTVLDMAMQATNEEEIDKRLAALEARAVRKGAQRWGASRTAFAG